MTQTELVERLRPWEEMTLADKLQRFIDMPEWPRFYMDKEQAAECVTALAQPQAAERIEALEKALRTVRDYGCPVCNGDCGSANPPVAFCPMQMIRAALHPGEKVR